MKILEKLFFSTRAMTVMLFIYAIAMAVATFIENDFGTPAAKEMIYNARWFDILQVLLIINFAVNIWRYRLWRKEKWSILLFHVGFIVTFIGAGITHFFSVEGTMNIREGETSNEIVTHQTYVKMNIFDEDRGLVYDTPYQMTYFNKKDASFPFKRQFKKQYQFKDRIITLKSLDFIPHAKDTLIEGLGKETLELVTVGQGGRQTKFIQDGEMKDIGGIMFSLNNPIPGTFQIFTQEKGMFFKSPLKGEYVQMQGQAVGQVTDSAAFNAGKGKVVIDSLQEFKLRTLYNIEGTQFVMTKNPFKGTLKFLAGNKNDPQEKLNPHIIKMEFDDGQVKDTLIVKGAQGNTAYSVRKSINGLQVSLGFGSKIINTPFGMKLRDFQLERYPGSMNPSSFASEISVVDNGVETEHRIYMNNVLDYGGYRFFQSSYDPDELGTVLSVNQDRAGTYMTYIGYFMMFIGMLLSLFWKGTRFWDLQKILKNLKTKAVVLFLMFLPFGLTAQEHSEHDGHDHSSHNHAHSNNEKLSPIKGEEISLKSPESITSEVYFDAEHIKLLERLQVQDDQGRMKPLGTHALELLRKIYKKDAFHGVSATEWFMSVQQNPALWAQAPLIRVNDKIGSKTEKALGAKDGYTSLLNLVDPMTTQFKLTQEYNDAFRKKPAEKTQFDKEVLNITERFTIIDNIAKGYHLKIIPGQNDLNESWSSWIKPGDEIEIDTLALGKISKYFNALGKAQKTGDWKEANNAVKALNDYQQKWGQNVVIPQAKVSLELLYNHLRPFFFIMIAYSIIGGMLLIFAFMRLFSEKKYVKRTIQILLGILAVIFLLHATALGVRWYISGHAPWTNGYEAVIFISWVGVLAGFLMYRNGNAFLPTAGAAVAVIMMGFAHGSSLLDPQITPLVPVLKSYWLIIHVAIITSSYGFFGLGMVISIFCLILFMLKPTKMIEKSIKELTIVNEMALTVGIFMLTIGTFLGGMWANESWGRYWSWDPKETWAFISIIVYAIVLHMRLVPGLRGKFAFNIASLWAVGAPIMTYFGVNYYLSGLHTYAAGDSIPIPFWVPIAVAIFFVLSIVAYFFRKKYAKENDFVKM